MTEMDSDIQFGDLEEQAPQPKLRPDQNKHFAVVTYDSPQESELPVYVDVDVLRDMEAHALSDTSVELGGVLLGGQYEDRDGNPFVLISDSLRAAHYESTKGSFKFTHDTWSAISRERDEFPEELQMVGWYHTHPGWGVFLSGMDKFICHNFFNKKLDVALVIDPCQQERAFFEWTGEGDDQPRQMGGFYIVGSRFRLPELEIYSAHLQGKVTMAGDPRYGSLQGGPIVHVHERSSPWQNIGVLGMLTMQFCLLALIAWRIILPPDGGQATADAVRQAELRSQRQVLDRVIGKLDVAPEGLVDLMEENRKKNDELEAANLGLLTRVRDLGDVNKRNLDQQALLKRKVEVLEKSVGRLKDDKKLQSEEIDELEERLAKYEDPEGDEETEGIWARVLRWKWYLLGLLLVFGGAVALILTVRGPRNYEEYTDPPSEEDRVETNNP
jgi:proteasome lid subunit RPN8/RPN11